jgi:hypothetical protein
MRRVRRRRRRRVRFPRVRRGSRRLLHLLRRSCTNARRRDLLLHNWRALLG